MSDSPPILLQLFVTVALFVVFLFLSLRYRKAYLKWLTAAWLIYVMRLGAILAFVDTGDMVWLWLHQCAMGWMALMLLAAAWSFSHRRGGPITFGLLLLSVPVWSAIAIFVLDEFLLAAGGSTLLLSAATGATAWAFYRLHRDSRSRAALGLAVTLTLWALHHLDYPLLRARGTWNPWGYYLDIVFELALGFGVLLLVLEEVERGLRTLGALTFGGDSKGVDPATAILERLLTLPGVRGGALLRTNAPHASRVVGTLSSDAEVLDALAELGKSANERARPLVSYPSGPAAPIPYAYVAALPLHAETGRAGNEPDVLIVTGDAREPFAALDEQYLRDLGLHVGAALMKQSLLTELSARTEDLADLSARMVRQNEAERRRLARELSRRDGPGLLRRSAAGGAARRVAERGDPRHASPGPRDDRRRHREHSLRHRAAPSAPPRRSRARSGTRGIGPRLLGSPRAAGDHRAVGGRLRASRSGVRARGVPSRSGGAQQRVASRRRRARDDHRCAPGTELLGYSGR